MEELTNRVMTAISLMPADNRLIVGIVGYPGAGKSTLAGGLVDALNCLLPAWQRAQIVPMDGYHLPNETLDKLGLRPLKGIPATFDPEGFAELLTKIRQIPLQVVKAPAFDRTIDSLIEDAIEIGENVKVVVTEGNYLLLDQGKWSNIAPMLDDSWFLDASMEAIRPRLIARHVAGGRSPDEAVEKVESTDLPNARLIEKSRTRARAIVTATQDPGSKSGFQYRISEQER